MWILQHLQEQIKEIDTLVLCALQFSDKVRKFVNVYNPINDLKFNILVSSSKLREHLNEFPELFLLEDLVYGTSTNLFDLYFSIQFIHRIILDKDRSTIRKQIIAELIWITFKSVSGKPFRFNLEDLKCEERYYGKHSKTKFKPCEKEHIKISHFLFLTTGNFRYRLFLQKRRTGKLQFVEKECYLFGFILNSHLEKHLLIDKWLLKKDELVSEEEQLEYEDQLEYEEQLKYEEQLEYEELNKLKENKNTCFGCIFKTYLSLLSRRC